MRVRIRDVANISCGLVVSRKKASHQSKIIRKYKQLNLRSISKNGYIIKSELEEFVAKELIDECYLTHEGDIIIRLTDPFTAVHIDKDMEGVVISSNFCIVRCKTNYFSKFLTYYLNGDNVKKILFSNLHGSIMKNINMADIAELEISDIDYGKQIIFGNLLVAQTRRIIILDKIKILEIKLQKALLDKIK